VGQGQAGMEVGQGQRWGESKYEKLTRRSARRFGISTPRDKEKYRWAYENRTFALLQDYIDNNLQPKLRTHESSRVVLFTKITLHGLEFPGTIASKLISTVTLE